MKIKNVANLYLVMALLLGALFPVMLKVAVQNINIYEFLFLTYLVALPTSFLFILLKRKTNRLKSTILNFKEFAFIAFLGVLYYGLLEYGLTYAEQHISVALASVIYRSFPLFMLIFLPIMLRERITKYQLIALVLAFAGLFVAITGGSLSIFSNANLLIIGFVIVIAFTTGFVMVAIKKYSFDMEIAMFIFNLATFVLFAALFIAARVPMQQINSSALVSILYVGIVYNVFVGLMYYGAMRMKKTTFVTNIYFLAPFITFLFSWAILGEQIYPYYIAVAVLVSAGIIIQKFDRKGGTYVAKSKRDSTLHDVTSAFVNTTSQPIYDTIKSGGRVLAIKLPAEDYQDIKTEIYSGKTLMYTDANRRYVNEEQREFINDIVGLDNDEVLIMSAGDPNACEEVLSKILDHRTGSS